MSERSEAGIRPARDIRIAAVTPFTTIDYPGKLAAVAFIRGCPWSCCYCHNPWMQSRASQSNDVSWDDFYTMVKARKGFLDAVVFSGGEPCIDSALPQAIFAIKSLGMDVGLHTGGAYPEALKTVLPLVDWVGLDMKAPIDDPQIYTQITQAPNSAQRFKSSFEAILQSGVEFEVRTTCHPAWLTNQQLLALGQWLSDRGVRHYALQAYRAPAPDLRELPEYACQAFFGPAPDSYPDQAIIDQLKASFETFVFRQS